MKKLILLAILVSCSSTSKQFKEEINNGRCDKASEIFPINKDNQTLFKKTKQVTKKTASLAIQLTTTTLGILISPIDKNALKDAKKARKEARELHCPDLDEITENAIELVGCYKSKGDVENLANAKKYLNIMRKDAGYLKCIDEDQKIELDNLHYEVETLYRYRTRSKKSFQ